MVYSLSKEKIFDVVFDILRLASVWLPEDVEFSLRQAYNTEENNVARMFFRAMLDNVRFARECWVPVCQDTGTIQFFVRVDPSFPMLGDLSSVLRRAVVEATKRGFLRPNTKNPFTDVNPGDNTGQYMPWVDWEIVDGLGFLEVTVFLKGGGSEAPSIVKTFTPAEGLVGVTKLILETISKYGALPCPPVVVGVGIGGTADIAAKLAKKALLRPVGQRNNEPIVAEFEEKLLKYVNSLGLGVHGVGGKTTALDVHVEYAYRHPAVLCAAVIVNCWAVRRATARIYFDGKIEYPSHPHVKIIKERNKP